MPLLKVLPLSNNSTDTYAEPEYSMYFRLFFIFSTTSSDAALAFILALLLAWHLSTYQITELHMGEYMRHSLRMYLVDVVI